MQCPQCKTHDVYVSQSTKLGVMGMLMVAARCHRCCLLFNVPRWKHVPDKPASSLSDSSISIPNEQRRRAA